MGSKNRGLRCALANDSIDTLHELHGEPVGCSRHSIEHEADREMGRQWAVECLRVEHARQNHQVQCADMPTTGSSLMRPETGGKRQEVGFERWSWLIAEREYQACDD